MKYLFKIYDSNKKSCIMYEDIKKLNLEQFIKENNINTDLIIIENQQEENDKIINIPVLAIYNCNTWDVKKKKFSENTNTIFSCKSYELNYETKNDGICRGIRLLSQKTNKEVIDMFFKIKNTYYMDMPNIIQAKKHR